MKKVLSLLLVIAQCVLLCSCVNEESDRSIRRKEQAASDTEGQYYLVKEAKVYEVDSENGETQICESMMVEFDLNYMPVTHMWSNEESMPMDLSEFCYETNGTITVVVDGDGSCDKYNEYGQIIYESFHSAVTEYEYKYDEYGNMLEEIKYDNNGIKYKLWVEYDTNNRVITKKYERWENGRAKDIEFITYDYAEDYIKVYRIEENSVRYLHEEYEFDENDKIIRECEYFSNGMLESVRTYEYDRLGRTHIVTLKSYDYGGEIDVDGYAELEYDEIGRLTKILEYEENGLCSYTEITYCAKPVKLTEAQAKVFRSEGYPLPILVDNYTEVDPYYIDYIY